jgi:hypothetical protein
MTYQIPVATKYYLRDISKTKGRSEPLISVPKADLNRTRNFLLRPTYHEEYEHYSRRGKIQGSSTINLH